jgi:hypothetical protein
MMSRPLPLSQRRSDIPIVLFFLINLIFITYIVDLENIVIQDPSNFTYPAWPPSFMIDAIHTYARNFDPVILARPVWWKMTIWIDVLLFGPFYVVALYAFIKGKEWIRIPSIIYSSVMLTNVTIILGEEFFGPNATPQPLIVFLLNLSWLLIPIYIIYRMWRYPHPFTQPGSAPESVASHKASAGVQTADPAARG